MLGFIAYAVYTRSTDSHSKEESSDSVEIEGIHTEAVQNTPSMTEQKTVESSPSPIPEVTDEPAQTPVLEPTPTVTPTEDPDSTEPVSLPIASEEGEGELDFSP